MEQKIELNTKDETEFKEATNSLNSTEKELPRCPGKTLKDRIDMKDKNRRAENT